MALPQIPSFINEDCPPITYTWWGYPPAHSVMKWTNWRNSCLVCLVLVSGMNVFWGWDGFLLSSSSLCFWMVCARFIWYPGYSRTLSGRSWLFPMLFYAVFGCSYPISLGCWHAQYLMGVAWLAKCRPWWQIFLVWSLPAAQHALQ